MKTKQQLAYEFDLGTVGPTMKAKWIGECHINDMALHGKIHAQPIENPSIEQKAAAVRGWHRQAEQFRMVGHGLGPTAALMNAMDKSASSSNLLDTNRCVYTVLTR